LSPAEASLWRVAAARCGATAADEAGLRMLCRWWCEVLRCDRALAECDPSREPGAYKVRVTNAAIATDKMMILFARYGLTPLDRAKVKEESPAAGERKVTTRQVTARDLSPAGGG
jgi:hypothetical protein